MLATCWSMLLQHQHCRQKLADINCRQHHDWIHCWVMCLLMCRCTTAQPYPQLVWPLLSLRQRSFLRKKGTYTWINTYYIIFVMFLQQIIPLLLDFLQSFAFFFMSKRISQHVGKILDDVLSTRCLAGWDDIFSQHRAHIPDILPTCRHVLGWHSFWGSWRYDTTPTFPTKDLC